ncbi:MAG: MoaD/ThiS family protein [Gemmatimonadota bacterium]
MRVNLLLFAVYRDLTGVDELVVDLPEGSDAADAIDTLRSTDRRFARIPARPVIAVNREYVLLDALLRDGDELALIPPVAGG